jgi:nicotinamidase-related amidase
MAGDLLTPLASPLAPMVAPGRTALLIIDVQQDFAAPDGLMAQYGCDLSTIAPAIDQLVGVIAAARAAAVPVIFLGLSTAPETDSPGMALWMERRGLAAADGLAICRAGTPGAAFYELLPAPGDPVVLKSHYSGFHRTDMTAVIEKLGIDTLVVGGITTECCVDTTVRDAFVRELNVFLLADGTAAYDPEQHRYSLAALGLSFAIITDCAQVTEAWQGAAA